jgi:integrase
VIGGRDPESQGAVFPDSVGGHRDSNNVERDHRRVRRGTPFKWVVPHTYRKTVATMLDRQGLSARTIADQLGHARISMTGRLHGSTCRRPGGRCRTGRHLTTGT